MARGEVGRRLGPKLGAPPPRSFANSAEPYTAGSAGVSVNARAIVRADPRAHAVLARHLTCAHHTRT